MTLVVIAGVMLFYGGNRPLPLTVLVFATLALAALMLAFGERSRATRSDKALVLPALLYLAVLIWAAVQADLLGSAAAGKTEHADTILDPESSWKAIAALSSYAAVFFIGTRLGRSRTSGRRIIDAVALFGGLMSVYGIGAFLTETNPILGNDPTVTTERLTSTFANPNNFAFVAALACLACLTSISRRLDEDLGEMARLRDLARAIRARSWLFGLALLANLIALLLTASRGGVIVAAVATLFWFATGRLAAHGGSKATAITKRAAVLALATLTLVGLFLGSEQVSERLGKTSDIDEGRAEIFRTTWIAITDNASSGVDLGAYEEGVKPYIRDDLAQLTWAKAHNLYLELMLELGLPAFLIWLTAMGLIGSRLLVGSIRRQGSRDVMRFAASALILAATHSLIDFPLQMPATAALFGLILGVGWTRSWPSRRKPSNHLRAL